MKKFILCTLMWLWSGFAYANVPCTPPFTFVPGQLADANQVNANFTALVMCLANAAIAGNNTDITALLALTTPISSAAGGTTLYLGGAVTGTTGAYTVGSTQPTGFPLVTGSSVLFAPNVTNTGPATLAVTGTAATNIFRSSPNGPQALTGGELIAGQLAWAVYDGTQYELLSSGAQFGGFGPVLGLTAGATTDLGTVPTHNVNISGSGTITSFGSSASTTFPNYQLSFGANVALTNNATSLILPGGNNITTQTNDTATATYLGSGNWIVSDYSRGTGTSLVSPTPRCGFNRLQVLPPGNSSLINWNWDSAVLINPVGNIPVFSNAQSGTTNLSTSGVPNGMDGGGAPTNGFVFLWAIYNGTTWATLGTVNVPNTPPTMPAGYTYRCYMGAVRTLSTGTNLAPTRQLGNETRYLVTGSIMIDGAGIGLPAITSGQPGNGSMCGTVTPTWGTHVVSGLSGAGVFYPISAVAIDILANPTYASGTAAIVYIAPNMNSAGYATGSTSANPPPIVALSSGGPVLGRMLLENTSIATCINAAGGGVQAYGWKDAVNAN